jgi:very-short-patch-repair endonuclease
MFSDFLLSEYHPTKNQPKLLSDYKEKSNKKVWWRCSTNKSHEWEANIFNRTKGAGCPFCSGRKTNSDNSLVTKYPNLGAEWHPTKNTVSASEIAPGSNKKYWWKCSKNPEHEWDATPNSRSKGTGCPHCTGKTTFGGNTVKDKYPQLLSEWDYEKNKEVDPSQICPGSDKKVWWLCSEKKHSYESKINNRTLRETGCPYCKNRKVASDTNLQTLFPDIAAEWHPTKNKVKPNGVVPNYSKPIFWICKEGHEWEATPTNRTRFGNQCPACSGRVPSPENNLKVKHPSIAVEWHPTRNQNKKPEDFTASSHSKVWWLCPQFKDHEYESIICNRTIGKKSGCPFCNQSKMEKAVEQILRSNQIQFQPQKKFDDMRFKGNQLSYDFYLPGQNSVIECDGRQHFEEVSDYFHHNKSLSHQRLRDIVKNAYAAREGMSLLRISYTESDYIEKIVLTFLERIKRGERPYNFVGKYSYSKSYKIL